MLRLRSVALLFHAAMFAVCPFVVFPAAKDTPRPQLAFSCAKDNDLLAALTNSAADIRRYDTPQKAIQHAAPNTAVLILADQYPMQKTSIGADT